MRSGKFRAALLNGAEKKRGTHAHTYTHMHAAFHVKQTTTTTTTTTTRRRKKEKNERTQG